VRIMKIEALMKKLIRDCDQILIYNIYGIWCNKAVFGLVEPIRLRLVLLGMGSGRMFNKGSKEKSKMVKLRHCTIDPGEYCVCHNCKVIFRKQGLNLCPKGCSKMLEKVLVKSGSVYDDYEIGD
jgi:hypothetical protein